MRNLLVRFLYWLLGLLEKTTELQKHAEFAVRQVEDKFPHTSGEFKRSQALRMLMNITNAAERDCGEAIEKAVRRCLPR